MGSKIIGCLVLFDEEHDSRKLEPVVSDDQEEPEDIVGFLNVDRHVAMIFVENVYGERMSR
jgi:hypothetical protein